MQYTRLFADESGESHFEEVEVEFQEVDYAPPEPPLAISDYMKATQTAFLLADPSWEGEVWHLTPLRQFLIVVAGRFAVTVSDGETREFGMGEVILLEDTHGKGHSSKLLGDKAGGRRLFISNNEVTRDHHPLARLL